MKIALDIGHMGKRSRPTDRGVTIANYRESDLVLDYTLVVFKHLESLGHTVYILSYDNYSKRKSFCDEVGIEVHIQCHINSAASVGRYARVLYREDNESESCKHLCEVISDKLIRWLGNKISKAEVIELKGNERGYECLKNNIPSILFEPMFINNDNHLRFMLYENGLIMIGMALATAIHEWSTTLAVKEEPNG